MYVDAVAEKTFRLIACAPAQYGLQQLGVRHLRKRNSKNLGYQTACTKRAWRKVREAEKRRIKLGGHPHPGRNRPGKLTFVRVPAPPVLDMFSTPNRGPTLECFHQLRLHGSRAGVGVRLDLSRVTEVYSPAALMLRAEVDRVMARASARQPILCARPTNARADEVFAQIGLYERVGISCDLESSRDDVKHWRLATGVLSEGVKGGSILEEYEGRLADGLARGLYEGIVEAMTNTVHHAYEGDDGRELRRHIGKRWWMLSQERDGMLTVAICDLGIGIPRSLPRSGTFSLEAIRDLLKGRGLARNDASAIEVAIELGRTSTNMEGRGRGLSEIVDAANLSETGSVLVSSNRGVFTSGKGGNNARNHYESIRGTLIWWAVPIADSEQ